MNMFLPGPTLQERRGSRVPCPSGNGTMIGNEQQFVVYCDTRFRGDELFRQTADSLMTCTQLCTSFQNPRCEGAQFRSDNNDCVLIGNLIPEGTRPSRILDSAAAIFPQPGPTSSCSQQGTGTTFLSQTSSYTLRCGEIVNGNDLMQTFQTTFESCLAACSANSACGGVSYDPSQSNGFKNCYLKMAGVDDGDMFSKSGVDSAVLIVNNGGASGGAGGANANGNQAAAGGAATGTGTETAVAGIPTATDSGTGSGGSGVVTVSVPVPVPAMSTSSSSALADSTPEASTAAASADTGDSGRPAGLGGSGRPKFGNVGPSTSSNAWIAAPVIGGIAALTLVLAVFILWGRRRKRDNNHKNGSGNVSRTLGGLGRGLGDAANRMSRGRLFNQEKTKLGSSDSDLDNDDESRYAKKSNNNSSSSNNSNNNRGGFKVVSGSGRRLGLSGQQEILGTGPGLGGMMIVTTGGGRIVETNPTGADGGGLRSNSPTGSAGLRDSQNGLRQNRLTGNWLESQPGIPIEFHGPDFK